MNTTSRACQEHIDQVAQKMQPRLQMTQLIALRKEVVQSDHNR